jgi:cobalt-precorrin 5A hydrolase
MRTAVLVLTDAGLALARRLRGARPDSVDIFGPSCVVGRCGGPGSQEPRRIATRLPPGAFEADEPGIFGWVGPLRRFFPEVWGRYEAVVAVMALGIVVRLVGPLATDKRRDPAVVAVDDAGRFAIGVLGGHGAGANALTLDVAATLGATPVVTTASEALGLPAVDLIGHGLGWVMERRDNLTRVAAAVVRREPVAVWQDAGRSDWWRRFGSWPGHFVRLKDWGELSTLDPAALLVISDRDLPDGLPEDRTLVYRPPSLVAGIGCRRGAAAEAIARHVEEALAEHRLAGACLGAVATVTLKLDEPGLLAFARSRRLPLVAFPPEQLAGQPGVALPSERVQSKIGIPAVAEPAALRAAGANRLVVAKRKGPGVTVAIARRTWPDLTR